MRLVRMKLLLDQAAFGEKLGVNQGAISRLETGKIAHLDKPFTTTQFREVVGTHFMFIMMGTNPERYSAKSIQGEYWRALNAPKGNRTTYRMTEHARMEKERLDNKSYVTLEGNTPSKRR